MLRKMRRTKDYMLSERELLVRRTKRRKRALLGAAALVLVLAIFFGAHPVASLIKGWQARRHANRAFALIDAEKWLDARNEATAAYQLRPTEPDALRAVARFLSRTRQAQALEFWDSLAKSSPLTRIDLRDEAAVAFAAGDDTRAARAIDVLLRDPANVSAGDWLLTAQLAVRRNSPVEAHDALQKILAKAEPREKLQAALLESAISSGHDDWRADSWARVKELAGMKDAVGLDALTVLAQTVATAKVLPEGFPISAAELAAAIENHPLARAPQRLLAVDLKIHEHPEERETLLASATAQWKDSADPADVAALAAWLNAKGEYERQLQAIRVEQGLQSRDIFLQHVDALGALGRWSEIQELLDSERYPLEAVVSKMYLARCDAQLGQKAAAENNWQRALEIARGDPSKLLTLAGYAEKNGAIETAEAAYREAAAESPKLRAAQQGRLRIAQGRAKTAEIHAVLAEMLQLWPNDSAVQNDEAYLRLLLFPAGSSPESDQIAAIAQLAAKLVEKEPASLPHRTLLALALLQQNRAADALAVYAKLQITPGALTSSALAVHAAVLAANGNTSDAQTEARQVAETNLLPEERSLIAALL